MSVVTVGMHCFSRRSTTRITRRGTVRLVRFRPGARLDTGQVQDRRGVGGRRGLAVGGGVGGLIVVVALALLGVDVTGDGSGTDPY